MKMTRKSLLFLFTALVISSFNIPEYPASGNIHVVIKGIDGNKGQMGILLFEKKEGFPEDHNEAMKLALIPLKGSELRYSFKDLPYGTYAVSVMHDANKNNKLDTNFFGVPEEGFGVSNNAKGTFSAPKFEDASFSLNNKDFTTTIDLNY